MDDHGIFSVEFDTGERQSKNMCDDVGGLADSVSACYCVDRCLRILQAAMFFNDTNQVSFVPSILLVSSFLDSIRC